MDEAVIEGIQQLASGKCVPCNDAKPFTVDENIERLKGLPGWVLQSNSIEKEFRFKTYLAGLNFASTVGRIADLENHHPDLHIGWRMVRVRLSTHTIKGLSRNDFIIAAKAEIEYFKHEEGQVRQS